MLPMKAVRLQLGALLSADATTLAPASTGNKVSLIGAAFSANELLTVADLTLLSGGGLSAIVGATGAQPAAQDPITGDQIITILPATGGWRWVSSGGGPYPIMVYGIALTDNAVATLIGITQFATPIAIPAAGYQIDADPIQITFVLQPMS